MSIAPCLTCGTSPVIRFWDPLPSVPLPQLTKEQVFHLQSPKGYDRLGVLGSTEEPLYLVSVDNGIYRCTRQHLRLVNEPVPPSRFNGISPMVPRPLPDSCPIASPLQSLPLQSPLSPTMPTTPVPSPVQSPLKEEDGYYHTHAGCVCKPNWKIHCLSLNCVRLALFYMLARCISALTRYCCFTIYSAKCFLNYALVL